jgi:hypothetical protein
VTSFPLVFCYRDLIAGRGFVAGIETKGSLVLSREPEGWTLYGVNPGGLAGGAEDRDAAFADFRRSYQEALSEIAHEAENFASFKVAVERFIGETNDDVAAEWNVLRQCVRDGELDLDLEKKDTSDFSPGVDVFPVGSEACSPDVTGSVPSPELNAESRYLRAA